jgi:hypothetical protein
MTITIDRRKQVIVDMTSLEAIKNAIAVDLDANTVIIVERNYGGEVQTAHHFPCGLKIVSRY